MHSIILLYHHETVCQLILWNKQFYMHYMIDVKQKPQLNNDVHLNDDNDEDDDDGHNGSAAHNGHTSTKHKRNNKSIHY